MAIQVQVPSGQASGSGSIWRTQGAQVLHCFLAPCSWRAGEEARVSARPHVLVCTLKFRASILPRPEPRRRPAAGRKGRQG